MGYDMLQEDVPSFQTRVGDYVVHGSNNSCLILGRDRAKDGPATVDDGNFDQKGSGVAHVIAGRQSKDGDPDFKNDSSFVYLAMKTKVDTNLNIQTKGASADNDVPAAVVKSDHIRVMSRKNVKIVMEDSKNFVFLDKDHALVSVGDGSATIDVTKDKISVAIDGGATITVEKGKIVVDGDAVQLGKDATERVLLGDSFKTFFMGHKHPTGTGPSGPPIDPWIDANLMSQRKVTVK